MTAISIILLLSWILTFASISKPPTHPSLQGQILSSLPPRVQTNANITVDNNNPPPHSARIMSSSNNSSSNHGSGSNDQGKPSSGASSSSGTSKYAIVKDGWGDRRNFQASYGLKMTPDDLEEGRQILEKMQEYDAQNEKRK